MTTATQRDARGELESLAEQIAREVGESESSRDSALAVLAKGMSDAINSLIPMAKAKVDLKNEGGEGPTEASGRTDNEDDYDKELGSDGADKLDEEPGEDYDDEYKGGGYEDMRMGDYGDGEFVDATEFLAAMQRENRELRKMVKGLVRKVDGLQAFIQAKDKSLRTDVGVTLAELAKGTVGLHKALLDTPMVPANPSLSAKHRLLGESLGKQLSDSELSLEQMAKALQGGIVDEDQYRYWKKFGEFPGDDQSALTTKIKAL